MPSRASRRGGSVSALPPGTSVSTDAKPPPRPVRRPLAGWPLAAAFALVCCAGALYTFALLLRLSLSSAASAETEPSDMHMAVISSSNLSSAAASASLLVPPAAPPAEGEPRAGECYAFRDYGLVRELRASAKTFCSASESVGATGGSDAWRTSYAFLRSDGGGVQASVFRGLRMDLSRATVARDIRDLSQDGGDHDPRFTFDSVRPLCACAAESPRQDAAHGAPRVWNAMLAKEPSASRPKSAVRSAPSDYLAQYLVCDSDSNRSRNSTPPDRVFADDVHVVVLARKDDHNPFFQVSAALNAWLMLRVLNWSTYSTQLVYLDRGIPSPVDELQHRLVAPARPALASDALFGPDAAGKTVHFGSALLPPFESSGPLMRHLDDKEPCARSQLVRDFRGAALAAMGVDDSRAPRAKAAPCLVTVISRRAYGGRRVQRMWLNEAEVLDRMRADYGGRCSIQSVDFVDLTMAQQMRAAVDSDVVIGMHGAGLVNVLWTRPETLVLEIFPRRRFRWGFRNICQHVGCDWHEFRGGKDVLPDIPGKPRRPRQNDPNAFDKNISPDEWAKFAYPLMDKALARLSLVETDAVK